MENVLVVGASNNEERYSNKAMKMLEEYGHTPIPVAYATNNVLGRKAYTSVADVHERIDTVTVYVAPQRQNELFEHLIALKPKRVIFNPGSENPDKYRQLEVVGIEVIEGCTLVLLRTGQF